MIWRGIFQQFTFRGDNGQLFGERVRYPMNMFLFTIYFCMGYTGYFYRLACRLLSRLRFARKIFWPAP
ncbi:hypothetical protein UA44_02105 [Klebsiella aerogenes]|nr:hypothetical protein UA44_02105 [Klebsiella aerogenes]